MKWFILATVLAFSASAKANVYVSWSGSTGFYFDANPSVGILGDGTGLSTFAQLIWSSDNIRDAAVVGAPNHVSGDDVWLADLVITEDGIANDGTQFDSFAWFTTVDTDDGGLLPTGGYVYARIFQDSSVDLGDWYFAGSIVLAADLDPLGVPADSPQSYELNIDLVSGDSIDGTVGNSFQVQPVPEPGTMALFALGLVTLGASRRRRKVQA